MNRSKKIKINIFIAVMILSSIAFTTIIQANSKTLISINDVTVTKGETGSIFINGSGFMDLFGSCQLSVSWDPIVVSVVNVSIGDVDNLFEFVDNENGSLSLIGFSTGGLSSDFVIAEIEFEAIGGPGDSCDLVFEESSVAGTSDDNIMHETVDGTITIKKENNDGNGVGNTDSSIGNNEIPVGTDNVVADASLSDTEGFVGKVLLFDGSRSTADGIITSYNWDFNDGSTGVGMIINHSFSTAGNYQVSLTVTTNLGSTDNDFINVTIFQLENFAPTKPVITGPDTGNKNTLYEFIVLSTDADNDTIRYHVNWDDGTEFTTPFISQNTSITLNHSWSHTGRYLITITADDSHTLSENTTHVFLVDTEELYYGGNYLGYITDENNDGIFDTFEHNPESITYSEDLQLYLIDINADGIWDYTYDAETKNITRYEADVDTNNEITDTTNGNNILLYGLLFIFLLGSIALLALRRKIKR